MLSPSCNNQRYHGTRKYPLCGYMMQRRSIGSKAWNNKRNNSRKRMKMNLTKEGHPIDTATKKQESLTQVNFRNPGEREAHIHTFLAWLPKILHEAPGIRWERLPSEVMGYLVRTVA